MKANKVETALVAASAGLLGATVGFLFAPRSGRVTRRKIRRAASSMADQARDFQEDLNLRIEGLVAESRELGRRKLKKRKDVRQSLLKALRSSKELIDSKISQIDHEFHQ